jgi:predicted RNase H-like HicB family nuclease
MRYERLGPLVGARSSTGRRFLWKQSDSSIPTLLFGLSIGSSAPDRLSQLTDSDTSTVARPIFHDHTRILGFYAEPYKVVKAIPVTFRNGDLGEFVASFETANISFVGESLTEALNGLKAEILNTLEDYEVHESQLGPEPLRQLAVLRKHVNPKK